MIRELRMKRIGLSLLLLVFACGDDDTPPDTMTTDGGTDSGAEVQPVVH